MERVIFPKIINIELTTYCPYKCPQCYKIGQNKKEFTLGIEDYKEIIDEVAGKGCKKVLLSGGEPLTYGNLLEAVEYAKNYNMKVYISTGGFGATPSLIEDLKRNMLDSLYVSLNGSVEKINSLSRDGYKSAVNAIEICNSKGLPVKINWVARKDNYLDFVDMIHLAERMDIDQIDILRNKPDGNDKICNELKGKELRELANIVNNYTGLIYLGIESCYYELKNLCGKNSSSKLLKGCSAGKYSVTINAQKQIAPCAHGFPDFAENLEQYSNIDDYWRNSPIISGFRKEVYFPHCSKCMYFSNCEPCKIEMNGCCGINEIVEEGEKNV